MAEINISGIEDLQGEGSDIEQELEARQAQEKDEVEKIRERILEGETTGDPLKDLVIVRTHRLDQEVVEMYRDLSARVATHMGEPVLVVGIDEEQTSFSLDALPDGMRHEGMLRTHYGMGLISDEELRLEVREGLWSLPTAKYSLLTDKFGASANAHKGSLRTGQCMGFLFHRDAPFEGWVGEPLELKLNTDVHSNHQPIVLEVFVGASEIDEYLKRDLDEYGEGQLRIQAYNELAKVLELPERRMLSRDEFYEAIRERKAAQAGQSD